jgi:HEAT repeat protein
MDDDIPMDVREAAVFGLSQSDGSTAGPVLRRIARSTAPTELRENAVFWLGQSGDPQAVEFLIELARGSGPLAEKAVFGLSQHDSPEANRALKALVIDPNATADVRENAIFWLGQSDDDGNVDFLREVYAELEDPDLKEKVIFSMSQVGGDDAVTWLLAVAGDRDEPTDVRKNALFWAGQTEGARDRLIALYDEVTDRDIKQQLIFVYSQADDDASLRQLMDIARNETDHDLRENAIFWLGQSDTPEALAFLEDLIDG